MKFRLGEIIQQTRQYVEDNGVSLDATRGAAVVQQQYIAALEVAHQTIKHRICIVDLRVKPALAPAAQTQSAVGKNGFELRISQSGGSSKEARRLTTDFAQDGLRIKYFTINAPRVERSKVPVVRHTVIFDIVAALHDLSAKFGML